MTRAARAVDLWLVDPQRVDPPLLAAYERLMCEEEQQRRTQFLFERDRREYVIARALVRTALSEYAVVPPEAWRFSRNEYGRPEVAEPCAHRRLRFNLSHTDGLLACAVVPELDIGVDVENMTRDGDSLGVAEVFFAPPVFEGLLATPEARRRQRFFEYWTLSEAFLKGRGAGLHMPLSEFHFVLGDHPGLALEFSASIQDEPINWRFAQLQWGERHLVAVALRAPHEAAVALRGRAYLPLRGIVRDARQQTVRVLRLHPLTGVAPFWRTGLTA